MSDKITQHRRRCSFLFCFYSAHASCIIIVYFSFIVFFVFWLLYFILYLLCACSFLVCLIMITRVFAIRLYAYVIVDVCVFQICRYDWYCMSVEVLLTGHARGAYNISIVGVSETHNQTQLYMFAFYFHLTCLLCLFVILFVFWLYLYFYVLFLYILRDCYLYFCFVYVS